MPLNLPSMNDLTIRRYAAASVLYEMLEGIDLPDGFSRLFDRYASNGSADFQEALLQLDPDREMYTIAVTAAVPEWFYRLPITWQNALIAHAQRWLLKREGSYSEMAFYCTPESVKAFASSGKGRLPDRSLLVLDLNKIYPPRRT